MFVLFGTERTTVLIINTRHWKGNVDLGITGHDMCAENGVVVEGTCSSLNTWMRQSDPLSKQTRLESEKRSFSNPS
jgi:hypothetical protein